MKYRVNGSSCWWIFIGSCSQNSCGAGVDSEERRDSLNKEFSNALEYCAADVETYRESGTTPRATVGIGSRSCCFETVVRNVQIEATHSREMLQTLIKKIRSDTVSATVIGAPDTASGKVIVAAGDTYVIVAAAETDTIASVVWVPAGTCELGGVTFGCTKIATKRTV